MNNWRNILKESRQVSQTGIKTKIGTKPLNISDDEEEDEDCCQKIKDMWKVHEMIFTNRHMDLDGTPIRWTRAGGLYSSDNDQRLRDEYDKQYNPGLANKSCKDFKWQLKSWRSYYSQHEEYKTLLEIWEECEE